MNTVVVYRDAQVADYDQIKADATAAAKQAGDAAQTAQAWAGVSEGLARDDASRVIWFTSRAEAVETAVSQSRLWQSGAIIAVGDLQWRYDGVSTAIADMPGWVPVGRVDLRHFGDFSTGTLFAIALKKAVDWVGSLGGGTVHIPAGTFFVGPHIDETVAANEGAAVVLDAGNSNVLIQGVRGATYIKPTSNKIEVFHQDGAANVKIDGIIFDNSDNGVLQNQVKVGSKYFTLKGGVAGYGNLANCAIRQVRGSGLKVTHCGFRNWACNIMYFGDFDDDQVLSGTLELFDIWTIGSVQGALVHQPRHVFISQIRCRGGVDSTNIDASIDPGHQCIYLTNRPGAFPLTVLVNGVSDEASSSSAIKIRKAEHAVVSDYAGYGVGRGIELFTVKKGTVSGCSVTLDNTVTDGGRNGIEITDCGDVMISDGVIDVSGADGWGLRIRADNNTYSWCNDGVTVRDVKIIQDYSTAIGKAPVLVQDQDNPNIDVVVLNRGPTSGGRWPIDANNCSKGRFHVEYQCPGGAADAYKLVELDGNCTGCKVFAVAYEMDADFVFGSSTSTSIYDQGTNTEAYLDGYVEGTWTPAIEWSTGAGTFSATYNNRHGEYRRYHDRVEFNLKMDFTPSNSGTASGNFRITLPGTSKTSSSLTNYPVTLGEFDNFGVNTNTFQVNPVVINGQDVIQFAELRVGTNNSWTTPDCLTDSVAHNITVSGSYLVSGPLTA